MYIYEAPSGSLVEIMIKSESKKIKFNTVVITGIKSPNKALIIEPVYVDNKMVSFKGNNMNTSVIINDVANSKLLEWNRVSIGTVKGSDGKICHMIQSDKEGKKINRRSNFRVSVTTHGKMMMNFQNTEYDVIIRDISANGYSFVCDSGLDINISTPIAISFYDEIVDVHFTLMATVIRIEPLVDDPNSSLIGCRLHSENVQVNKYVVDKQRSQAKNVGVMDERSKINEGKDKASK